MDNFSHPVSEQLRATALALPETSEGDSCVNRALAPKTLLARIAPT